MSVLRIERAIELRNLPETEEATNDQSDVRKTSNAFTPSVVVLEAERNSREEEETVEGHFKVRVFEPKIEWLFKLT